MELGLLSSKNLLSKRVCEMVLNNLSIEVYYQGKNYSFLFVDNKKIDNLMIKVIQGKVQERDNNIQQLHKHYGVITNNFNQYQILSAVVFVAHSNFLHFQNFFIIRDLIFVYIILFLYIIQFAEIYWSKLIIQDLFNIP